MTALNRPGSLINHILENTVQDAITVGMGATRLGYSDRTPYTVSRVAGPKTVYVQYDEYERTDSNGMSDCQSYTYTPCPDACEQKVTLRKDGTWRGEGTGARFTLGLRERYFDFSF